MTNKKVVELAKINDIRCEVRQRGWNWLGQLLSREGEIDCLTALGWTPEGRRAREDHKLLLRKKRNKAGWKSWEVEEAVAKHRKYWLDSVDGLCALWCDESG